MIKVKKIRNSTSIDEAGFKFGIVRQEDERINSYRERVYKAMKCSTDTEKYSFEKNFDSCTSLKGYNIFEIDLVDETLDLNIEIKDNRLIFYLNGEVFHNEKLSNLKFLFKVQEIFELYPQYFSVKVLTDIDYRFFKAKNLMQSTTERNYLTFTVNNFVNILPEKHVTDVQDYNANFITNTGSSENVNTLNSYCLIDNVLHKYTNESEFITFNYKNYPFTIKWLPINSIAINSDNFEDYIYDIKKDNENYGSISNNNLIENFEKNKILSQEGANIINKILTKENTYWGE